MNMIEKVAEAIYDAFELNNDRGGYMGKYKGYFDENRTTIDGEFNLSKIAKAAIQAMREPTEEMLKVGQSVDDIDLGTQYNFMIDAALKE